MGDLDRYAAFVAHPRYGRGPRYTGLDTSPDTADTMWIRGLRPGSGRIANTGIVADTRKQVGATFPITHYFDIERQCDTCGRMFIFFAKEQKYWYEVLQFKLDADCLTCAPCRKKEQHVAKVRQRYENLLARTDRSIDEHLTLATSCLELVELGVFSPKQTEHIRAILNSCGAEVKHYTRVARINARLRQVECDLGASKP